MKYDALLAYSDEIFMTAFQSHYLFESILLYFKHNVYTKGYRRLSKIYEIVLLNVQKAFQTSSLVEPLGYVRIGFRALSEREECFVTVLKGQR